MAGIVALAAVIVLAIRMGPGRTRPGELSRLEPKALSSIPEAPTLPLPSFPGVIISESVEVSAPFDGRLEKLSVLVGDSVETDAEVGRFDAGPLKQEEAMAEARLAAAQSELSRLTLELAEASERLGRYLRSPPETVSPQELDSARYQEKTTSARLETARAEARERQAALAQTHLRLAAATLRAPFPGRVVERFVSAGTTLRAGTPIVRLVRSGPVQVRFAIPEDRLGEFPPGTPVSILLPALGRSNPGHVERVSPEVDSASQMIFALALFDAPANAEGLVVGMGTRVSLRESSQVHTEAGR